MRKLSSMALGLGVFIGAMALPAAAQNQPATGQTQPGNGGGRQRGNYDPAAMRQQMLDRVKAQLGATDEEWTALQPRLEKVMTAQRDARAGGFGGRGGGRRGNNQDPNAAAPALPADASDVAKAQAELRAAIDNKETPAADLAAKLKTLRDAKDKAKATLTQSQKELKELLTQRQEAVLVNMGMLE